jgi:hypothetical protein
LPKYEANIGVKDVAGSQQWEIEADSPEDALRRWKAGEGEVVHEELEVQSLDDVYAKDFTEVT